MRPPRDSFDGSKRSVVTGIGRKRWATFVLLAIAAIRSGLTADNAFLVAVAAVYPSRKNDAAKRSLIARLLGERAIRAALIAAGVAIPPTAAPGKPGEVATRD